MFSSRLLGVNRFVSGFISGGYGDAVYGFVLVFLLCGFLSLRIPYLYAPGGFGVFLVISIFPLFTGLFLARMLYGQVDEFFSNFIPEGTPMWIAPFVCMAETLSYLVRPIVLMIRPFVNLSVGITVSYFLAVYYFISPWVCLFIVVCFFYEVFVSLVHWYIVCSILDFSQHH